MGIRIKKYQPIVQFSPNALVAPEYNGAPITRVRDVPARAFDDSTAERVMGSFRLPETAKNGLVQFSAYVEAATAADARVSYSLGYKAVQHDNNMASPWLSQPFAKSFDVDNVANRIYVHKMTFDVSLGEPGELVYFDFGRYPNTADTLEGDLLLYYLTLKVPV